MPVFICSRCGAIDNSACDNNYWNVMGKQRLYQRKIFNEAPVCTSCTPIKYNIDAENGKGYVPQEQWHNRFEKQNIRNLKITKEELIQRAKEGNPIYENTLDYFEKYENMTIEEFDKLTDEIDPESYD